MEHRVLAVSAVETPATSGRLATAPASLLPAVRWVDPGAGSVLFGLDEFDCAEPVEWPVDEEDLEREIGLEVGL
jgi:hypothetical protein